VKGVEGEVTLKATPVIINELTVNAALPVLETVTDRLLVWPTETVPNASVVEDKLSWGALGGGDPEPFTATVTPAGEDALPTINTTG